MKYCVCFDDETETNTIRDAETGDVVAGEIIGSKFVSRKDPVLNGYSHVITGGWYVIRVNGVKIDRVPPCANC